MHPQIRDLVALYRPVADASGHSLSSQTLPLSSPIAKSRSPSPIDESQGGSTLTQQLALQTSGRSEIRGSGHAARREARRVEVADGEGVTDRPFHLRASWRTHTHLKPSRSQMKHRNRPSGDQAGSFQVHLRSRSLRQWNSKTAFG
jgi:hypothetical protein